MTAEATADQSAAEVGAAPPTAGGGGTSSGSVGGGAIATPMNGNITKTMHGVDAIGMGRPVNIRTR